jgi:hypothetical protein
MDAISAVVELAKERNELSDLVEEYEDQFEELVGKTVSIAVKSSKKKTVYVEAIVDEFVSGEGWVAHGIETDEVYELDFLDFARGDAYVVSKRVTFEDQ